MYFDIFLKTKLIYKLKEIIKSRIKKEYKICFDYKSDIFIMIINNIICRKC